MQRGARLADLWMEVPVRAPSTTAWTALDGAVTAPLSLSGAARGEVELHGAEGKGAALVGRVRPGVDGGAAGQ